MKNSIVKNISIAILSVVMFSEVCIAKGKSVAPEKSAKAVSDVVKLLDIAGRQRMLSQRIAKDYLYSGEKVATSKADKQLTISLESLLAAHKVLAESINDPEIINLLAFVEMSSEDFKVTANEEFTLDNAQLVLDLSESMLEGSQYIVDSLKAMVKINESKIVGRSGKQRMLAQRIAKYYIAYQSGIKDKNTVDQMKKAIKVFSESHGILMQNSKNTPEINRKLNKIDRLWKIVYKFYLNIEKGGLPLIVFNTTDNITKNMNEITKLYMELYK